MSKIYRLGWVLVCAAIVVTVVSSQSAFAQGLNFGGSNQSSNREDDDDDDDKNQNNQGGNRSSQSGNPNTQQFQQFFPGGQSGQGQGGSNQFRRSNQQGQFQGQQLQNQQFQNWQQQGNQSGLKIGGWQSGKWQGSHDIQKWTQAFGGNQQPFSSQWYEDHPKAWKYNNNKANVLVVSSVPGLYSWLGWGNVPPQYNVGYGNVQEFDHSHYGQWYPLGVYSLMAGPGDMGTRITQLAVDQHGHVAGNYYDMITNSAYNVSGDISQQSQRVSWSLNKNQFIRFRAHISQLLQPYGTISVQLPGGEQQWQFVRLEN